MCLHTQRTNSCSASSSCCCCLCVTSVPTRCSPPSGNCCNAARLVSLVECVGLVGCRVTVFCGLGVASYPQPPDRSQHGCTVGIDRDPPVWHLHPGRVVEVPERQLSRTSVLVLVLLYTWLCLVMVVFLCRTVCHPHSSSNDIACCSISGQHLLDPRL